MEFRTCFSSICESGYGIDAIKSGMQKYLRRREPSKMKWCVRQMQLFAFGKDENEQQIGKGIITNLVNRQIIMLDEEVLFADWQTYLDARKLLAEFQENTKVINPLYRLCDIMCDARLLRLGSDVACYYGKAVDGVNQYFEFAVTDEVTIQEALNKFVSALTNKDIDSAYSWAFWLFHNRAEKELANKIYRRTEPVYVVWQYIMNEAKKLNNDKLMRCLEYRLEEFHNKARPERKLFLVAAVSLYFYRDQIDWTGAKASSVESELIEGEFKLDDYVLDMHCKDGRKLGKTTSDFATQGAVVVNEDMEYYNEEWRQFYVECKMADAGKPKKGKKAAKVAKPEKAEKPEKVEKPEKAKKTNKKADNKPTKDELNFIPMSDFQFVKLCMEQPCGKKAMTFVVEYEGKRYVLKEGRKSMNYNEEYEIVDAMKPIFGLNSIGMSRILSDKIMKKVNDSQKSWVNNWQFVDAEEDVVYTMMTYVEPSYRFNKAPAGLIRKEEELEYMKVGLFRGIFGVSDFNVTNVIISDKGEVFSIDEHDFLGTREKMIGNMNMRFYKKHINDIGKVFEDLYANKEQKKVDMAEILEMFGYEDKVEKVIVNYDSLAERFWKEYNELYN